MWKHPLSAIVAGPLGCGKSQFVSKFIKSITKMCDTTFSSIFWNYGGAGDGGDSNNLNINHVKGLLNLEDFSEMSRYL